MTRTRSAAATLAAVTVCALLLASSYVSPAAAAEELVKEVCPGGGDANLLMSFPRFGKSQNLADYDFLACSGTDSLSCESGVDEGLDIGAVSADERHVGNWFASIFVYFTLGIVLACLTVFCGCLTLCGKHCCNCGGWCGKRHPTLAKAKNAQGKRKSMCCCCGNMGFVETKTGYGYSCMSKTMARGCILVFMLLVIILIALGQTRGNQGVTQAMKDALAAPEPMVDIMTGVANAFSKYTGNLVGDTVVGVVTNVNKTITGALDIPLFINKVECFVDKVSVATDLDTVKVWITNATTTIDALVLVANRAPLEIDGLVYQRDNITAGLNTLQSVVDNVVSIINTNAIPAVQATQTSLNTIDTFIGDATTKTTQSQTDLAALAAAPSTSDRNDATTSGSGSITRLVAGSMDGAGNAAERTTLTSRIQALYDNYNGMPDFSVTATRLTQVDSDLDTIIPTLDAFATDVAGITTAMGLLPTFNANNATIQAALQPVYNVNLQGMLTLLDDAQAAMDGRPSAAVLKGELQNVKAIRNATACVIDAADQAVSLNETIMDLGSQLDPIMSMRDDINSMVDGAIGQIETHEGTIDSLEADIANVDVASRRAEIAALQTTVDDALSRVDLNPTLDQLKDFEANRNFDTATVNGDVANIKTTLNSNRVSAGTTSDLNTFETARVALVSSLATALADLAVYNQGYCSTTTGTLCSADGDCPGAETCLSIGVRRCKLAPATACTSDGDCTGGGDSCLIDTTEFNSLAAAIGALNVPDMSAANSAISSSLSALSVGAQITTLKTDMTNIVTEMGNVATTSAAMNAQIASISTEMGGDFDSAGAKTVFTDLKAQLAAVDTSSFTTAIDSADSSLSTIRDLLDLVDLVLELLRGVRDLLFTDLPPLLRRLDAPRLQTIRTTQGAGEMVDEIVRVADEMVLKANASINLFAFSADLQSEAEDAVKVLNVLTQPGFRDHGALYFIAELNDAIDGNFQNRRVVRPGAGSEDAPHRMFKDEYNNDYAADGICVTTECLEAEIDYMNTENLQTVTDGMVPVPLSRENVFSLFYTFPILFILIAFLALICFCGAGKGAQCCAGCLAGLTWAQLPCLFVVGGLLIPFPLLLGDVCHGFENIGYNIVLDHGGAVCSTIGGVGDENSCLVLSDVGGDIVDLELDLKLKDLYAGLLGTDGCTTHNGAATMDKLWADVRGIVSPLTTFVVNETVVVSANNATNSTLRPAVLDVFYDAGGSFLTHTETLVNDMSDVLSCEAVSDVFAAVKGAVCCDALGAAMWLIVPWYLMAWVFCCCGVPGGLLGRKRLGEPWGPDYKQLTGGNRRRQVVPVATTLQTQTVVGYGMPAAGGYGRPGQLPPLSTSKEQLMLKDPYAGAYGGYQQQPPALPM